jgi:hypothetical protein
LAGLVAWRSVRRLLITTVATTVAMALGGATMAHASGTATATLTPNKASAPSAAMISITGESGFLNLPTSVALVLQPGFTSSAQSVSVLCTSSQASSTACPAESKIGAGSVGVSLLGFPSTVPVTLYLGQPLQAGDIASVILSGSYAGSALNVSGRMFVPAQGGIEVLLSGFPSVPVTLNSLSISLAASRSVSKTTTKTVTKTVFVGKGKHRHKKKVKKKVKKTVTSVFSLLTNPSSCSGMWGGTATLTYTSGTDALPLGAACTS